ncbi:MAG: serine hydrolase, partial [Parasporobacterium sp.]|nr:serine hydrolase [Parasporobacterium sp.]
MMDLVQNTLSRFVSSGEIAGCSVRIMRDDEVCFEGSFGYADIENKVKISDNTIFPIASMSKVITAAGIMQLYEQGLFKMWDPVSAYLPGFKNPKVAREKADGSVEIVDAEGEVTMRQLFTMTSGVPYGSGDTAAGRIRMEKEKEYIEQHKKMPDNITYANMAGQLPLAFEPGEKWMYGFSIDVLGAVIEVLTGKTLGEYLKENITDPLGMKDTGFFVPAGKQDRIATLYHIKEGMKPEMRKYPSCRPEFESGGGGLFSTVRDYSRFAQMLLHGGTLDGVRILGRKTVALMATDHLTPSQQASHNWDTQRGYGYGLGVRVMTDPQIAGINGSVGEWGWDGAFGNWFCIDPKENLTCVY